MSRLKNQISTAAGLCRHIYRSSLSRSVTHALTDSQYSRNGVPNDGDAAGLPGRPPIPSTIAFCRGLMAAFARKSSACAATLCLGEAPKSRPRAQSNRITAGQHPCLLRHGHSTHLHLPRGVPARRRFSSGLTVPLIGPCISNYITGYLRKWSRDT
jgi:hypothetical protein